MKTIYPKIKYTATAGSARGGATRMPKSVFTDAYQVLLRILVAARREAGVSQVELARRLGKPQPFVSYFERGERRVDVIEFYAIAKALGYEPVTLFQQVAAELPETVPI